MGRRRVSGVGGGSASNLGALLAAEGAAPRAPQGALGCLRTALAPQAARIWWARPRPSTRTALIGKNNARGGSHVQQAVENGGQRRAHFGEFAMWCTGDPFLLSALLLHLRWWCHSPPVRVQQPGGAGEGCRGAGGRGPACSVTRTVCTANGDRGGGGGAPRAHGPRGAAAGAESKTAKNSEGGGE